MPDSNERRSNVSDAHREPSAEAFATKQTQRTDDDAPLSAGAASGGESGKDATTGTAPSGPSEASRGGLDGQLGGDLATTAATGLIVAMLNAELLPGVLIGAGALLARRLLPDAGPALQPLLRETVKAGYGAFSAVQSILAEAAEQVEDMVAEARAEQRERSRPSPE